MYVTMKYSKSNVLVLLFLKEPRRESYIPPQSSRWPQRHLMTCRSSFSFCQRRVCLCLEGVEMSNYGRVINHATSVLCSNKGSMELLQLYHRVFQRFDIEEDDFWYIVTSCPRFAVVRNSDQSGSDCIIVAKTSLRLCWNYPKQKCTKCQELHLCKYFIYGTCRYGKGRRQCKFSHDVWSEHNYPLLRECSLHELQEDDLFLLLLQNDSSLLPEVCSHYSKGSGPSGQCSFGDECSRLHLCLHFIQGDCIFGPRCKRLHSVDAVGRRLLQERGLGDDIIRNVPVIYQNVLRLSTYMPTSGGSRDAPVEILSQEDRNVICLHFIRRTCKFQEQCKRVHFNLPYKWEVFMDGHWIELRDMEEIERAYCNPQNTHSPCSSPIDFLAMMRGSDPVRRLSTISSVTKPPYYVLTTQWLWYYKGENSNWIEYGLMDDKGRVTSLSSRELEESFQSGSSSGITVTKGHRVYTINFHDMYQRNPKHNTKRKIRRRPRFVSVREVESKLEKVN
uniref:Poly (ADP-ribose) polymerase family, member 12b n=2 Tax=Denticeps clupeoides TaxID=299321 RepID=A0AAY4AX05_9TELE